MVKLRFLGKSYLALARCDVNDPYEHKGRFEAQVCNLHRASLSRPGSRRQLSLRVGCQ
jgi:hypothetical protein